MESVTQSNVIAFAAISDQKNLCLVETAGSPFTYCWLTHIHTRTVCVCIRMCVCWCVHQHRFVGVVMWTQGATFLASLHN